jgi:DNA invertase Pin-like site-specific DNA recombinase
MKYGYARVSTEGQSVDAQVRTLRAAGARHVFRETASGTKTNRSQLRRVLDQLSAGDVLMVTRLDRLARSTRDLLNTLATITAIAMTARPNEPKVAARSRTVPILATPTLSQSEREAGS